MLHLRNVLLLAAVFGFSHAQQQCRDSAPRSCAVWNSAGNCNQLPVQNECPVSCGLCNPATGVFYGNTGNTGKTGIASTPLVGNLRLTLTLNGLVTPVDSMPEQPTTCTVTASSEPDLRVVQNFLVSGVIARPAYTDTNRRVGTETSMSMEWTFGRADIVSLIKAVPNSVSKIECKQLAPCVDLATECSIWAAIGQCTGSAKDTVLQKCPKSCNACPTATPTLAPSTWAPTVEPTMEPSVAPNSSAVNSTVNSTELLTANSTEAPTTTPTMEVVTTEPKAEANVTEAPTTAPTMEAVTTEANVTKAPTTAPTMETVETEPKAEADVTEALTTAPTTEAVVATSAPSTEAVAATTAPTAEAVAATTAPTTEAVAATTTAPTTEAAAATTMAPTAEAVAATTAPTAEAVAATTTAPTAEAAAATTAPTAEAVAATTAPTASPSAPTADTTGLVRQAVPDTDLTQESSDSTFPPLSTPPVGTTVESGSAQLHTSTALLAFTIAALAMA